MILFVDVLESLELVGDEGGVVAVSTAEPEAEEVDFAAPVADEVGERAEVEPILHEPPRFDFLSCLEDLERRLGEGEAVAGFLAARVDQRWRRREERTALLFLPPRPPLPKSPSRKDLLSLSPCRSPTEETGGY